jgi:hypothetical protein
MVPMTTDGPDVIIAKRLLDHIKLRGAPVISGTPRRSPSGRVLSTAAVSGSSSEMSAAGLGRTVRRLHQHGGADQGDQSG